MPIRTDFMGASGTLHPVRQRPGIMLCCMAACRLAAAGIAIAFAWQVTGVGPFVILWYQQQAAQWHGGRSCLNGPLILPRSMSRVMYPVKTLRRPLLADGRSEFLSLDWNLPIRGLWSFAEFITGLVSLVMMNLSLSLLAMQYMC